MKLLIRQKGGPGSGHHGHEGRPGEVGGSQPSGGNGKAKPELRSHDTVDTLKTLGDGGTAYWITPWNKLLDVGDSSIEGIHLEVLLEYPEAFGTDIETVYKYWEDGKFDQLFDLLYDSGYIRVHTYSRGTTSLTGLEVSDRGLRKLRNWVLDNKIVFDESSSHVWGDRDHEVRFEVSDLWEAENIRDLLRGSEFAYKQDYSDHAMIAFNVTDSYIEGIQEQFGDDAVSPLHITLYYLGKADDLDAPDLKSKMEAFAKEQAPVKGMYNGYALFGEEDGKHPLVLLYDSPQLPILRYRLWELLPEVTEQDHGFTPHTTLAYVDKPYELDIKKHPMSFDSISLHFGGDIFEYPLTGNVVEKQLPIDDASRAKILEIRKGIFNNEVDALAEDVFTGSISIGGWEESMKQLIREHHTSMAAIGKGGWDEMNWADWGRLGNPLKQQYRYLHNFAENIAEKRDSISLKAIKARAHMYGEAGGHSVAMAQAGRISDLLPWMPKDGSTECLVNCKCYWKLDLIDKIGERHIVQAVWNLRPAEHCVDCLDRRGHIEVISVHESVKVPEIIGGF